MKFSSRGFTLVELMIVIAIIGILAASLFPLMTGYLERSRDAGRIAALNNIKSVLQTYYADQNGRYPEPSSDSCLSSSSGGHTDANFKNMFSTKSIPTDPRTNSTATPCITAASYGYKVINSSGSYALWAKLENIPKSNATSDNVGNSLTASSTGVSLTPYTGSTVGSGYYVITP